MYCRYRVVAPDLRSHGETTTTNDLDFSAEVGVSVVGALVLFGQACGVPLTVTASSVRCIQADCSITAVVDG